jgi:MFS transporter, PPP family, 3-phenylpropionic acid transporter
VSAAPRPLPQLRGLSALFFFALASVGAVYPFLALDLRERGVSASALVLTMTIAPLMNLFAAPVWSALADRYQAAGRLTTLASALGVVGIVLLAVAPPLLIPAAMLVFGFARAPMAPLLDGMAMEALGDDRAAYGRMRRWGSLGFLLAAFIAPFLWERVGLAPLWLAAMLGTALLGLAMLVPSADRLEARPILPALRRMAKDPVLPWLLVAGGLHFSGHIAGTSFLAVHFDAVGIGRAWSGVALSLGVAIEIFLFSISPWLLRRFGAWRLLLLAVGLALPRWLLSAAFASLPAQLLLSASHGVTFGAFWIAGVALIAERAPEGLAVSAQGVWAAAVGGLGALVGNLSASVAIAVAPTHMMFVWAAGAAVVALVCTLRANHLRRPAQAPASGWSG